MTYEIEIEECAFKPLTFREDNGWGALDGVAMEYGKHFRFISQRKNSAGQRMCMTKSDKDKYAPMVTGVYNVFLAACT